MMHPYMMIGERAISSYQACLMIAFALGLYLILCLSSPPDFSERHINTLIMVPTLYISTCGR